MIRILPMGLIVLLLPSLALSQAVPADTPELELGAQTRPVVAARLADARAWRERIGLEPEYRGIAGLESIKIAVLDYGFDRMDLGRPYLPESTEIVEHYPPEFLARHSDLGDPNFRKPFEPGNGHGRAMAQIVWAATGADPRGPRFYLLNAGGPTLLRRAVRYAIEQEVDLILFSNSFEGGGNGDGRGPINRIVSEAHAAGIIWINASGNHGGRVHNAFVDILPDGHLRLGKGRDIAALRFRNRLDENTIIVTLTWNDYREIEDAGTTKDLDLYVEDWTGRRVGASELVQIPGDRAAGPGESRNPRERVILNDLPASPYLASNPDVAYRIRVRVKGGTFEAEDRVRVLVTSARESFVPRGSREPVEAVEFLDASRSGEIYPPADHPLALTVGAYDPTSSIGPTEDRRVKPDVLLEDSEAFFTDGTLTAGSSNAAAYFAGIVAVLKAAEPNLSTRHLLALARNGGQPSRLSTTTPTASTPAPTTTNLPPYLERRRWKTPSRAELAEAIR
ncbi:hypothetical protein BH23PLA1_BH23PLA1_12770 [soil metagenome]